MLRLSIKPKEFYDEEMNQFCYSEGKTVELEHSLSSISKWEIKHHKPFYAKTDKTTEETMSYIQCMVVDPDADLSFIKFLSSDDILTISNYINDSATATWFTERQSSKPNTEIITSEIIFYWMFSLNIPMECADWHINRLLTLIRVINAKNNKKEPMSKKDLMARNRNLNKQRRAAMNSKG